MTAAYTTGTITLTAGSTAVTGTGTGWQTALITGGTIYPDAPGGNALPIASVDSNIGITAAIPWRGASGTYSYALMRDTAYGQQVVANAQALADYIARLDNKALAAFVTLAAGMAANKLPYMSGSNTMALADFTAAARTLLAGADVAAMRGTLEVARTQANVTDTTTGRSLIVGAFGIGGVGPVIGDCGVTDNSIAPGVYAYQTSGGTPSSGGPAGVTTGILYHSRRSVGGGEFQIMMSDGGSNGGAMFYHLRTAGAWLSWKRLDVVYGTNANGVYVRFPDGTQICQRSASYTVASVTAIGNIYNAPEFAWTFPAAFADTSVLSVSGTVRTTSPVWINARPSAASTAQIRVLSAVAANETVTIDLFAIGRYAVAY